jgi:hypothetical protein
VGMTRLTKASPHSPVAAWEDRKQSL